jgi:hypothetical protein
VEALLSFFDTFWYVPVALGVMGVVICNAIREWWDNLPESDPPNGKHSIYYKGDRDEEGEK